MLARSATDVQTLGWLSDGDAGLAGQPTRRSSAICLVRIGVRGASSISWAAKELGFKMEPISPSVVAEEESECATYSPANLLISHHAKDRYCTRSPKMA